LHWLRGLQHVCGRGGASGRVEFRHPPAATLPCRGRGLDFSVGAGVGRYLCRGGGVFIVRVGRGIAAVFVCGAPDVARNLKDGLLVRGAKGEGGAGLAEAGDAIAVLALEAAELLDELALGEVELEAAAHVLVEGVGVVLVRRERRAARGGELSEAAEDHDLVLLGPEALEQRPPLPAVAGGHRAAAAPGRRDRVGQAGGGGSGGVGEARIGGVEEVGAGEVAVFRIAATAIRVGEGDAGGGRRFVAGGRHWIGNGIWKGLEVRLRDLREFRSTGVWISSGFPHLGGRRKSLITVQSRALTFSYLHCWVIACLPFCMKLQRSTFLF